MGGEGKEYEGIGGMSLKFSPHSERVAYAAKVGSKQFVVVDGKEQKQYDGVGLLTFSPQGNHIAYAAKRGDKWLVVIDGKEEKQYDIVYRGGVVFDSPDSLHYLAQRGNSIYLVKKWIK